MEQSAYLIAAWLGMSLRGFKLTDHQRGFSQADDQLTRQGCKGWLPDASAAMFVWVLSGIRFGNWRFFVTSLLHHSCKDRWLSNVQNLATTICVNCWQIQSSQKNSWMINTLEPLIALLHWWFCVSFNRGDLTHGNKVTSLMLNQCSSVLYMPC